VVNDQREFGRYVGHHGIVMENGLPSQAEISVRRAGDGPGCVYDLVHHRQISSRRDGGTVRFPVQLGPCDGGLYLVTDAAIAGVEIQVPEMVARGEKVAVRVRVVDAQGQPIAAVIPLEVTIQDAESRVAEFSGFYAAAGGQLDIPLDVAANDAFGVWSVQARELASGQTANAWFRVTGPSPWPPTERQPAGDIANPVQPKG
jgi:hypothetical protein